MGVGWSVDYAAHIAYAFLNTESRQSDKNDRNHRALEAVRYIGAAVAYGAGSTWLAVSMLSFSTSHIYISFFKIFYLVILFGVWHGLFFLPVVLSTIGPRSLRVISQSQPMSEKTAVTDDDDWNKETDSSCFFSPFFPKSISFFINIYFWFNKHTKLLHYPYY